MDTGAATAAPVDPRLSAYLSSRGRARLKRMRPRRSAVPAGAGLAELEEACREARQQVDAEMLVYLAANPGRFLSEDGAADEDHLFAHVYLRFDRRVRRLFASSRRHLSLDAPPRPLPGAGGPAELDLGELIAATTPHPLDLLEREAAVVAEWEMRRLEADRIAAFLAVRDRLDRLVYELRTAGLSWAEVGEALVAEHRVLSARPAALARQRWRRMRRDALAQGCPDPSCHTDGSSRMNGPTQTEVPPA